MRFQAARAIPLKYPLTRAILVATIGQVMVFVPDEAPQALLKPATPINPTGH